MKIIADTHVHFYPNYDLGLFLNSALTNFDILLQGLKGDLTEYHRFIFLCDRNGQANFKHTFCDFNLLGQCGYSIRSELIDGIVEIADTKDRSIFVVSGRQIITKEKIEVLGLLINGCVDEGLLLSESISSVVEKGGVPILSWSPGKWLFERGELISKLLNSDIGKSVLVGDISMRSKLFGYPQQFQIADRIGISRIVGSDPLPFIGEERLVGKYATLFDCKFNMKELTLSKLKEMLLGGGCAIGVKNGPIRSSLRLAQALIVPKLAHFFGASP